MFLCHIDSDPVKSLAAGRPLRGILDFVVVHHSILDFVAVHYSVLDFVVVYHPYCFWNYYPPPDKMDMIYLQSGNKTFHSL